MEGGCFLSAACSAVWRSVLMLPKQGRRRADVKVYKEQLFPLVRHSTCRSKVCHQAIMTRSLYSRPQFKGCCLCAFYVVSASLYPSPGLVKMEKQSDSPRIS